MKFSREFIFADWRFFVFCGNKFLRLGPIGFSCWKLIFSIFRKYPVPSIDNMFVFIEYVHAFLFGGASFVGRSSKRVLG